MEKYKPSKPNGKGGGGDYFAPSNLEFIDTGCTLLNCILGGGWVLGRPVNIVGDKSVGKTLLAIEACANFARQYPNGYLDYREAEAAFDVPYATTVGLPKGRVNFGPEGDETLWNTIDSIWDDLEVQLGVARQTKRPGLYIVDSLDALSSEAELGRDRKKGTYGMDKAKILSQMFRQNIARDLKRMRKTWMIISQIRDNIGATFGAKYARAGGKALDFYSNQTVYLSHMNFLTKEINGIKKVTGIRIRAKCTKNKVRPNTDECTFVLRFGYGIDDLRANIDWLGEVGKLSEIDVKPKQIGAFLTRSDKLDDTEYRKLLKQTAEVVTKTWRTVDAASKPGRSKYG